MTTDGDATHERPRETGALKVALVADLHLDSPFAWAGHDAGGRWRRALRDAFVASVDLALDEGVDALFLAGDIYEHDRIAPDTSAFLAEQLARMDATPVLVAPGNHDYLCPSSIWVQSEWSPNVRVFGHSRWTAIELVDGLTVWGVAHGRPAGTGPMLQQLSVIRSGVNVGLFHGALRSGVPPDATPPDLHLPFDRTDVERAGLSHAFVGHYHTPVLDSLLTYPGNPSPLRFGEAGDRGVVIASIHTDGRVESTSRRVAQIDLHDVEVDVTGAATSSEVRERCRAVLDGLRGGARLTLTGDLAADVDLIAAGLGDLSGRLDAVTVRTDRLRPAYDLEALRSEPTVRGQFVRDVLDDPDLDESDRWAVLVTGLRALDGRSDLEVPW